MCSLKLISVKMNNERITYMLRELNTYSNRPTYILILLIFIIIRDNKDLLLQHYYQISLKIINENKCLTTIKFV